MPGLFVTGTDTDVGKTVAAIAVLRGLVAAGLRAVGMKPVSAGVTQPSGLNDDVVALHGAGNVDAPLGERNPFAFAEPSAPHLVARRANTPIAMSVIREAYERLAARADVVLVEGAGGALVPLDDRLDMLDIARELQLPVLLVVGIRLGCINHARLTALAIRARGLALSGWIASRIEPRMDYADQNVAWLADELPARRIADFRSSAPPPLSRDALAALQLLR